MLPLIWAGVVILFFSCSNPQTTVLTSQENTLRNVLQNKNSQTIWAKDLEAGILDSKMNTFVSVTEQNIITPYFLESINNLQPAVYPYINTIGSLDCSGMSSILLNTINDFAKALCSNIDAVEQYFLSDYFFNFVFFKKDFVQIVTPKENKPLFDNYLICQAFESQDLIQVPVRFYNQKDFVDLSVYLAYHGEYKITQIEIIRWGKLNGESKQSN